MRAFLPFCVHAASTGVLEEAAAWQEGAILGKWHQSAASARVVGVDDVAVFGTDGDVAGIDAAGLLAVQLGERSRIRIDCVGDDPVALFAVGDGVEKATAVADVEEAGVVGLGGERRIGERAGRQVERAGVDPLAARLILGAVVDAQCPVLRCVETRSCDECRDCDDECPTLHGVTSPRLQCVIRDGVRWCRSACRSLGWFGLRLPT